MEAETPVVAGKSYAVAAKVSTGVFQSTLTSRGDTMKQHIKRLQMCKKQTTAKQITKAAQRQKQALHKTWTAMSQTSLDSVSSPSGSTATLPEYSCLVQENLNKKSINL